MRWNEKHNTLSLTKKDAAELEYILRDWKHCGMDGDEADASGAYQERMALYNKWMFEIGQTP